MVKSTKIGLNKVDGPMYLLNNDVTRTSFILTDPTTVFTYASEQRLQCTSCDKVRYRIDAPDVLSVAIPVKEKGKDNDGKTVYEDVQLSECIDGILGKEALEYSCPYCKKTVVAVKWVFIILSYSMHADSHDFQTNKICISALSPCSARKEIPTCKLGTYKTWLALFHSLFSFPITC